MLPCLWIPWRDAIMRRAISCSLWCSGGRCVLTSNSFTSAAYRQPGTRLQVFAFAGRVANAKAMASVVLASSFCGWGTGFGSSAVRVSTPPSVRRRPVSAPLVVFAGVPQPPPFCQSR